MIRGFADRLLKWRSSNQFCRSFAKVLCTSVLTTRTQKVPARFSHVPERCRIQPQKIVSHRRFTATNLASAGIKQRCLRSLRAFEVMDILRITFDFGLWVRAWFTSILLVKSLSGGNSPCLMKLWSPKFWVFPNKRHFCFIENDKSESRSECNSMKISRNGLIHKIDCSNIRRFHAFISDRINDRFFCH